jgi:hypothetical protein
LKHCTYISYHLAQESWKHMKMNIFIFLSPSFYRLGNDTEADPHKPGLSLANSMFGEWWKEFGTHRIDEAVRWIDAAVQINQVRQIMKAQSMIINNSFTFLLITFSIVLLRYNGHTKNFTCKVYILVSLGICI